MPPSNSCSISCGRSSLTWRLTAFDTNLVLLRNHAAEILHLYSAFSNIFASFSSLPNNTVFSSLFFLFYASEEAASVNVYHEFYVKLSNNEF
jgi:hypothetical protein